MREYSQLVAGIISRCPKSCILLGVQRNIIDICGNAKERVFWRLMVDNPNKISILELEIVRECADALLNYWYVSSESPVSLFQQALINPTPIETVSLVN